MWRKARPGPARSDMRATARHGENNDAQAWAEQLDAQTFPRGAVSYGELPPPPPASRCRPPCRCMWSNMTTISSVSSPFPTRPCRTRCTKSSSRRCRPTSPARPTNPMRHLTSWTPQNRTAPGCPRTGPGWPRTGSPQPAEDSDALRRARLAEEVVKILEQHPGGATRAQIARETAILTPAGWHLQDAGRGGVTGENGFQAVRRPPVPRS